MSTRRTIQHILYATDLEAGGHAAQSLAVTLARQFRAKLHVLHVETPVPVLEPAAPAPASDAGAAKEVARIADAHPEVSLVAVARSGRVPSASILEYAAATDVDLIVMGATRLHRGFGHLLGSVAREVVDGSDRPVLTVRQDEVGAPPVLARVLVPVDFSPATDEALGLAAEIARNANGEVILLHVIEAPGRGPWAARRAFARSRLRVQAEARLRALAATLDGVRISTEVRAGSPVDEIVRAAAAPAVDLVVIASHASAGHRMVSGSIAEEVQRFASSPVLLVKAAGRHEQRAAG
jgi:nucleotide-binding universal stress UspA family protein